MRGMTAFARSQISLPVGHCSWELKTVNHRYLEMNTRLPEALRGLEAACRDQLKSQLHRGKVDCSLRVSTQGSDLEHLDIDVERVKNYLRLSDQLQQQFDIKNDVAVSHLFGLDGVFKASQVQIEEFYPQLLQGLSTAIEQLVEGRQREGLAIAAMLQSRLQRLQSLTDQARAYAKGANQRIRQKLLAKLADLTVQVDDNRIEQEIALQLSRLDVDEEIDRLAAHCKELEDIFQRKEPIGRRLDFIMQELNREANTLCSKSDEIELVNLAVEAKVIIEQMREQIQNIE